MFSKIYMKFMGCMMGAVLISTATGLGPAPQSFIMGNIQAKNVIREFLFHANATEDEIANLIQEDATLFDFTSMANLGTWTEQSDTVRTVGKSKAALVLQKTQEFQRAVFFTLLNPQANGAAFAGMRTDTKWDLSALKRIKIVCRAQGQNRGYKVVLRHKNLNNEPNPTYEQMFTVPLSADEFSTVNLPLSDFKPYYRGKEVENGEPLDTSKITSFGLQVYGGVYLNVKQTGVSSLEINTIVATV